MGDPRTQTWIIASGQTVSASYIDRMGEDIVGIEYPSALTGADFSFVGTNDNPAKTTPTWKTLTWEGTEVAHTAAADDGCGVDAAKFCIYRYYKLVSSVAQGAERTITPVFRRFG